MFMKRPAGAPGGPFVRWNVALREMTGSMLPKASPIAISLLNPIHSLYANFEFYVSPGILIRHHRYPPSRRIGAFKCGVDASLIGRLLRRLISGDPSSRIAVSKCTRTIHHGPDRA